LTLATWMNISTNWLVTRISAAIFCKLMVAGNE
jgi:hypothetical protein